MKSSAVDLSHPSSLLFIPDHDSQRDPLLFRVRAAAEVRFPRISGPALALEVNRPERIYIHYRHESGGPWWELAKQIAVLDRIELPTRVFGRPLWHYAHQCDLMRLLILRRYGGIYLDIDTLCVRPFTELLDNTCVMGHQTGRGLCNAVILSEPEGVFVNAWLDSFRRFRSTGRDQYWDEHAVIVPGLLAHQPQLRRSITICEERAFFFPHWNNMAALFESGDEALFAQSYCIHYWETLTRQRRLQPIVPERASRAPAISPALCGGPLGAVGNQRSVERPQELRFIDSTRIAESCFLLSGLFHRRPPAGN